jgi:hypothetical protein
MAKRQPQSSSLFDLTRAGLRATGARCLGELTHNAPQGTLVFERQCQPPDTRTRWYLTPDGRLWLGATFAFKQNPGKALREAVAAQGQVKLTRSHPGVHQPRPVTLEELLAE